MLTLKFFFNCIVPLIAANLFLFILAYILISRRRLGKEYNFYSVFLVSYIFYLIGPIVRQSIHSFPIEYLYIPRIFIFFFIGLPSLLIALKIQCHIRVSKKFIVSLYAYSFAFSLGYFLVKYKVIHLGRRSAINLENLHLVVITILPCLYFMIKKGTRHPAFINVFSALLFGCFMLVGAIERNYAIYFTGSIISALLWGYAIFRDLSELNFKLEQHQLKQVEWAALQYSKTPVLDEDQDQSSLDQKLDERYPFKEREQLLKAIKESPQDLEVYCDSFLKELYGFSNHDIHIFRKKCKEALFLIIDQRILFSGNSKSNIHSLETQGIKIDQATTIETIELLFKEEVLGKVDQGQTELETINFQVEQAQAYILKNYHLNIGVGDIAAAAHLSQSHIMKLFKDELGMTLNQYLTDIRLKKAQSLLVHQSVTKTALDVGFKNLNYFSTVFKKHIGMSPKQYQESLNS